MAFQYFLLINLFCYTLITGLPRCGKSCRLRWMNYLQPNLKRGNYTEEEELMIIKLHEELGNKYGLKTSKFFNKNLDEHNFIYKISPFFHALFLVYMFSYLITNIYEHNLLHACQSFWRIQCKHVGMVNTHKHLLSALNASLSNQDMSP